MCWVRLPTEAQDEEEEVWQTWGTTREDGMCWGGMPTAGHFEGWQCGRLGESCENAAELAMGKSAAAGRRRTAGLWQGVQWYTVCWTGVELT